MGYRQKDMRGFSLIEVLVAMAIMGVVVAAVYATFIATQLPGLARSGTQVVVGW